MKRVALDPVAAPKSAKQAMAAAARVGRQGARIAAHAERLPPFGLRGFARRVRLAFECVNDVRARRYRALPWATLGSLAVALSYFLMPLDAIPDLIPLSGFVDDAAVLGLVFVAAEQDLRRYCAWRRLDPEDYFA